MPTIVKEAQAAGAPTGSRTEITLITPGWGSSGFYSPAVLEQAAKDRVFPKNTQMHIDHDQSGGVGSVGTLAAALTEDARWEPNWVDPDNPGPLPGRLVAENRVFSHKREMLAEMKDVIGTSIAAGAEVSFGEAEGRSGKIIEALVPSVTNRVDYVTVAGRGGRISEVLEAHKVQEARNVGQWLEARMHSMFTSISDEMYGDGRLTREERITLSGALGDALTSFTATVEAGAPQLFERDLWEDPTSTVTAEAATKNSLPDPARATENQEEANMATIDDKELADLRESASRATALEAENKELQGKVETLTESSVRAQAEAIVAEAFGDLDAKVTRGSLVKAALVGEAFDAEALKADAVEAAAELRKASGEGTVRGVGESAAPATKTEVTYESATEAILKNAGYTPKGA